MLSQLTVFLENEKGRLANACQTIADNNINMHTLFVADTQDFGVARIFCDTPNAAAEALQKEGYRATVTSVLGVRVPNRKGGLAELLNFFDARNIDLEYCYCYSVNEEYAIDVLKINDPSIEDVLREAGYTIVSAEEIYNAD